MPKERLFMLHKTQIRKTVFISFIFGLIIACQSHETTSSTGSQNSTVPKEVSIAKTEAIQLPKDNSNKDQTSRSIRGSQINVQKDDKVESRWLFVGDSLTAGYGLEAEAAYVALIQNKILKDHWLDTQSKKRPKLINAGISGDTSAGALRRLDWLLADSPNRVFLCIGANDGLRGQSIAALKDNLIKIIQKVKSKGIKVTLMGMQVPPNYGVKYSVQFKQSYFDIAKSQNVPLYPFLLEGVGGVAELNQSDGIHPNHQGQEVIAEQLFKYFLEENYLTKAN